MQPSQLRCAQQLFPALSLTRHLSPAGESLSRGGAGCERSEQTERVHKIRAGFFLTNTPPVCYLYSVETAQLLTERCGTPQCSCAGRVNADRLGSLAQLLRKAAFFQPSPSSLRDATFPEGRGSDCGDSRHLLCLISSPFRGSCRGAKATRLRGFIKEDV